MRRYLKWAVPALVVYALYSRWDEVQAQLALLPALLRAEIQTGGKECDPSYPTVCIAPPPPFLSCSDIVNKNFKVFGSDPHGFDSDRDGIACEPERRPRPSQS